MNFPTVFHTMVYCDMTRISPQQKQLYVLAKYSVMRRSVETSPDPDALVTKPALRFRELTTRSQSGI